MSRESRVTRALAIYRILLRLYSPDFRREFGRDAEEMFEDCYREALDRGGLFSLPRFWVRTVANVVRHGPAERLSSVGLPGAGVAPGLSADIGFALRSLERSPRFAFGAVGTLALGVGASIALFSLVHGVLLEPLPFPGADRLVSVWENHPETGRLGEGPSPWNFNDWEREARGFDALAATYLTSGTFRHDNFAEETRSAQVTTGFFRVLGVEPRLGRDFLRDEGLAFGPVMLSDPFWRRVFGADPTVVGSTVEISGRRYEVAGVMPPGFAFPDPGVEYWVAWDIPRVYATRPDSRTWRFLNVIGRLAPGVDPGEAERELVSIHGGLADAYPDANRGWRPSVTSLHDDVTGGVQGTLWAGLGAVAALLLLACTNVANLLLARAPARSRELAVRSALGADRRRLGRQLLIENLVLAGLATAVGLGIAAALLNMIARLESGLIPRIEEVGLNGTVIVFAVLLTIGTSLLFGLAPVLSLIRSPGSSLRTVSAARGVAGDSSPLRTWLVAGQVGLTFVVVMGAALFLGTLVRLSRVDLGIVPEQTLSFRVSLDAASVESGDSGPGMEERTWEYYRGLEERLSAVPGVTHVGAAQTLPMDPVASDFTRPFRGVQEDIEAAEAPAAALRLVTPGYFDATGMRLLRGVSFTGSEERNAPLVAVVNQTFADHLWPGEDPLGRVFELDFREGWQPYRVVGVVADVHHAGPRGKVGPEVFLSHRQIPYLAMSVVLRTNRNPQDLRDRVTDEVLAHGPGQPPFRFVGLDDLLEEATGRERLLAALLAAFALFALVLATSGVYGLVAYTVSARTREYGIRMALGDRAGRLIRSIGLRSLKHALWGVAGGALIVLTVGPFVQSQLYEMDARDPWLVLAVATTLLLITGVASLLSARAVSRLEPSTALRRE